MVKGYGEAKDKATKDGHSIKDLCEKADIANKYGFAAWQFTKNGVGIDGATHSKEYDIHSIMHYTSENSGDPDKFEKHRGNAEYYPLSAWDPRTGNTKARIIEEPEAFPYYKITDLDKEAIKLLYP